MRKDLLVVCTGNLCRSPMAEGVLRHRVAAGAYSDLIHVHSAGTFAQVGQPASAPAVELLGQRGIDIGNHRAAPVTAQLLNQANLILVMEEAHRRSIFYYGMHYLPKVFLLSELAGRHEDIADPYGRDQKAYAEALHKIESYVGNGWQALLGHLKIRPPGPQSWG